MKILFIFLAQKIVRFFGLIYGRGGSKEYMKNCDMGGGVYFRSGFFITSNKGTPRQISEYK